MKICFDENKNVTEGKSKINNSDNNVAQRGQIWF